MAELGDSEATINYQTGKFRYGASQLIGRKAEKLKTPTREALNSILDELDNAHLLSKGIVGPVYPSPSQQCLAHVLYSTMGQCLIFGLIFVNFLVIIWQTNANVNDEEPGSWIQAIDKFLLFAFIAELIARIYIDRMKFFCECLNLIDVSVILFDVLFEILHLAGLNTSLTASRFLRVARLTRVARAYRVVLMLPKLAGMVRDLGGAMEAVFWGCLLLFGVMTLWSILTVQLVHPLVKKLAEDGVFADCVYCGRAYSSVMQANLTYFQQIIAGDSWGLITIPLIEHYPHTALLFIPVLITLNLAIINVILAVIVECAEETRKEDLVERMKVKEKTFVVKSRRLARLCADMDKDGSGDLTYSELLKGFKEQRDFMMIFTDMGIDETDLESIFNMMDVDKSGKVDYKEFVQFIHRSKTADETTTLSFIRHHVMESLHMIKRCQKDIQSLKKSIPGNENIPGGEGMHAHGSSSSVHLDGAGPILVNEMSNNDLSPAIVNERTNNDFSPTIGMPVGMHEFHSMCKQVLARFDDDLLGALSDISNKCEKQASLLADLSKPLTAFLNMQTPVRLAPSTSGPVNELMAVPERYNEAPQAYACVFPQCTVMRRQTPPMQIREWQTIGRQEMNPYAPPN